MRAAGRSLLLCAATALLVPGAAPAAPPPPVAAPCGCEGADLAALRDQIAGAETLEEAQQLAAPPLRLARSALERARWLAPGGTGFTDPERRLREGERAILVARTPVEAARAFSVAVSGSPVVADVDIDPPRCSYSTWEIVAIVLGFILGVIPGIILLIILC